MQQGLTLPWATMHIPWPAVMCNLPDMPPDHFPSFDLTCIFLWNTSPHIVSAIPLKPPSRIILIYPSFCFPYRKRLTGIDAKIIERCVVFFVTKLCAGKPACGKFTRAVSHVLTAKHPKLKKLFGGEIRSKCWVKRFPYRRYAGIGISLLHSIAYRHHALAHTY